MLDLFQLLLSLNQIAIVTANNVGCLTPVIYIVI